MSGKALCSPVTSVPESAGPTKGHTGTVNSHRDTLGTSLATAHLTPRELPASAGGVTHHFPYTYPQDTLIRGRTTERSFLKTLVSLQEAQAAAEP